MGSSIGNFSRAEAADFLGSIANVLKETDQVIIGIDGCQSGEKVYRAYNDREGKTHDFIRNGLNHANKVLGEKTFKQADFEIDGVYCQANTCHVASFRALSPVCIGTTSIRKGETIRIEESHKYSPTDCAALFRHAGLVCSDTYADSGTNYSEYLQPSSFSNHPPSLTNIDVVFSRRISQSRSAESIALRTANRESRFVYDMISSLRAREILLFP